jgi:hypothetical protein
MRHKSLSANPRKREGTLGSLSTWPLVAPEFHEVVSFAALYHLYLQYEL